MYLNEQIYLKIDNLECRLKIALALKITEQSVRNAIRFKRDILTKKAALDVIRGETGLSEDEIFVLNPEMK
ncbi:MAG TPA: hypothetical protein DCQ50_16780 [Chryseobacterium sp.]|nr:hypothetical protein [Chryseobacterium sp.]